MGLFFPGIFGLIVFGYKKSTNSYSVSEKHDIFKTFNINPRGAHKHFFDRDARPRTNFNYPKK